MLAELGSSPLGERYSAFVGGVDSSGNTRLDLNLFVPLHGKGRDIDVTGNILLNGNSLTARQDGIGFEKIKGELAFDMESLTGNSLQARLLDTPVRVDVRTDRQAGGLEISVQGPLDLAALVTKEQPELTTATGMSCSVWAGLKGGINYQTWGLNYLPHSKAWPLSCPHPLGKNGMRAESWLLRSTV
jgi:uncharacterized protein YhdP